MQKFLAWIKTHRVVSGVAAIIAIGLIIFFTRHTNTVKAQYITQPAEKTTITVAVSGTGQVLAENQIDLKPGSAGTLVALNVQSGQSVKSGQVIGQIDQSNNNVQLAQARAQLLQAQANYDKLTAGLTGIDLSLAQSTLAQAQTAVDRAYNDLLNSDLTAQPANVADIVPTISGNYTGNVEGAYQIDLYGCTGGICYKVSGLGDTEGVITRGLPEPIGHDLYVTFATTGELSVSGHYTISVPNKASSTYFSNLNSYNSAKTSLENAQLQFDQKNAPAQ
ncbi:MAG TPA: biotin/lipoyl-binding protein, partial [Methylomirabilota bacterium]|nr:biotin/lipoyl-binding protein [Methylomirabilota bacterium]